MIRYSGFALLLAASQALAVGKPVEPPKPPEPAPTVISVDASAEASAHAVSVQGQQQGQSQGQQQIATGGSATAAGGSATGGNALGVGIGGDSAATAISGDATAISGDSSAVAHGGEGGSASAQGGAGGDAQALGIGVGGQGGGGGQSDAQASASNEGNVLTVQTTYRQVRQAPAVSQGSLMIGQCGAGLNGGGSSTGGAAFLGIAWTPRECHKYLTAANYAALGMYSMACAILNTTRATKETVHELGIDMPSCDFFETTKVVEEVRYVTPEELDAAVLTLQERQDRAFRATQGAK